MMKSLSSGRQKAYVWAYALLSAAVILFFCTKSSPGYPINDWCDANIYLTIGKGMTRGQVVYRDLYDHKGPLLYALHALCAWVSFDGFLGVFLMEVLAAAAFLYYAWQTLALYGARRAAWVALPVLALAVYASYSFSEGDSAEELCMPLVAATLYFTLRYLRSGDERMSARGLMAQGALAGCVLWTKFTIIGMHAGLLLMLCIAHGVRSGSWRGAWRALGWLAAGFGLSTLPWLLYFGLNGAILPWLKVYFYDNLILYGGESMPLIERVKTILTYGYGWVIYDPQYTALVFVGFFWFLFGGKRTNGMEKIAVWAASGLGALAIFVGCKSYPYYGQALAPLAVLGLIPLCLLLEKLPQKRGLLAGVAAGVCAACLAVCPLVARNMHATSGVTFGEKREDTMQYRFAAIIRQTPNATLLNYGFMDAGFYTATGIVPNVKYFQENNVPLTEMYEEQTRYIDEALCDYVVTRGTGPESLLKNYELVDTADTPNFWYKQVFLYRRIS